MANFARPSSLISGLQFRSHNLQKGLTSIVDGCDLVASDIDDLPIRFLTKSRVRNGRGYVLDIRESTGLVSLAVYQGRFVPEDPVNPYSENVPVRVSSILAGAVDVVWSKNSVVQTIGACENRQRRLAVC